jgi:hypothetical protein
MIKIWVLSHVKKGFIQEPEIFYDKYDAELRKRILMKDFNSDYDELDIFEKQIQLGKKGGQKNRETSMKL